jgi:sigma-B regulation protein RsbU (phosphoserine phosphatase)
MSTFWKNIVNRGVTPELEFNIRNKIRIFNSSIFIIGCIYIFYTLVGFLKGEYLAGGLTFAAYVLTASCLYMMSTRRYKMAYHNSAIVGLIFLFVFSLLYGESTQTHIFILFIPVGATILFDDLRICFIYFIIAVLSIALIKLMFLFPDKLPFCLPYYPLQPVNSYLGIFNCVMTGALIFLAVRLFKTENILYSREIVQQRAELEEKNKDIVSSIHYAKRIQRVLLASERVLEKNLPGHFILYKPKDIVSGDFYWAAPAPGSPDKFLLCVGDCTGHGVPGAFMSLLGISFLNEITVQQKLDSPDKIFNRLREEIIKALNPEGTLEEGKDGMDAVMCRFDFNTLQVEFACSNNPVWIVTDKQLKEYKPDKFPIGMYEGERKDFNLQRVQLNKGDMVYLFTDGYADQFGGDKGKKFKYKKLQELLLENSGRGLAEQKNILDHTIESWKGNLEQVDDILIVGIRV